MTGVNTYSTTASENINANTGITWDEGMAPALVNNSARQNMADTRLQFNDLIWFQYGAGSKNVAHVYASGTSTTVSGTDQTAVYHAGRRVKAVGSGTGTIYGSIASSSFGSSTTTITYTWDNGSLSNETLTIYLSQVPVTGYTLPADPIITASATNQNVSGSPTHLVSVPLTPGNWVLTALIEFNGTYSGQYIFGVISTTSNSSTNTWPGTPRFDGSINGGAGSVSHPGLDVTVTSNTTYYLNVAGNSTSSGGLNVLLRAQRIG